MSRFQSNRGTASAPWNWAWWGLLAGMLLAALQTLPARWLTGPLRAATDGHLLLTEVRGSLWQGSARIALQPPGGGADGASLPGRVSWNVTVDGLALRLQVLSDCCLRDPMVVQLTPYMDGLLPRLQAQSSACAAVLPVSWLAGLGTPWNTIALTGQARLACKDLSLQWAAGASTMTGAVELALDNVATRLSPLETIGSYRLSLRGGDTVTFELNTVRGALQMQGAGTWVGGTFRFRGTAHASPGSEDALGSLLNILGRRDGAQSIISLG